MALIIALALSADILLGGVVLTLSIMRCVSKFGSLTGGA